MLFTSFHEHGAGKKLNLFRKLIRSYHRKGHFSFRFSLCKSISETTSDALVGFLNFWLQCPSATWHVYVYLGCIGNDQGPPPLRRGEHLAENHHPRSLRLRAPPLESEGPRNSPTSSHASTPRPCKLLQDTGRQDASRRNVLTYTRTQSLERTS